MTCLRFWGVHLSLTESITHTMITLRCSSTLSFQQLIFPQFSSNLSNIVCLKITGCAETIMPSSGKQLVNSWISTFSTVGLSTFFWTCLTLRVPLKKSIHIWDYFTRSCLWTQQFSLINFGSIEIAKAFDSGGSIIVHTTHDIFSHAIQSAVSKTAEIFSKNSHENTQFAPWTSQAQWPISISMKVQLVSVFQPQKILNITCLLNFHIFQLYIEFDSSY